MLTRAERDALIQDHLAYADALVDKLRQDLTHWLPREDLVAAGREGLVDAAQRYDPARGAVFTTFAYYRVRGAVLDHLRQAGAGDPVRLAWVSAQAAVNDLMEQGLTQSTPGVAETPADVGSLLAATLEDAAMAYCLGEMAAWTAPVSVAEDPETQMMRTEVGTWLQNAMTRLPPRERTLVEGVYLKGLTIEQSGAALGLSKAWASRLHARALARLRRAGERVDGLR